MVVGGKGEKKSIAACGARRVSPQAISQVAMGMAREHWAGSAAGPFLADPVVPLIVARGIVP